jgi:hypothetical protein
MLVGFSEINLRFLLSNKFRGAFSARTISRRQPSTTTSIPFNTFMAGDGARAEHVRSYDLDFATHRTLNCFYAAIGQVATVYEVGKLAGVLDLG